MRIPETVFSSAKCIFSKGLRPNLCATGTPPAPVLTQPSYAPRRGCLRELIITLVNDYIEKYRSFLPCPPQPGGPKVGKECPYSQTLIYDQMACIRAIDGRGSYPRAMAAGRSARYICCPYGADVSPTFRTDAYLQISGTARGDHGQTCSHDRLLQQDGREGRPLLE